MPVRTWLRSQGFAGSASERTNFGLGPNRLQLSVMDVDDREPESASPRERGSVQEWAAAAMSGNEAAFDRLYHRFQTGLGRFFLKRTAGRVELSDDLTQKTWVLVWRALQAQRYDPSRAAISTFIYAVGQNVWLQHRRASAAMAPLTGDFDDLSDALTISPTDPAAEMALAELLDALREAIRKVDRSHALTSDEREVVRGLAAGHTERGLAERLNVAASTVHARKVSAFGKLRRTLAERGFIGPDSSAEPAYGE